MTDYEYASKLYCEIFGLNHDNGDLYMRGMFEALGSLKDREQKALTLYYRDGLSFSRTAELLGVSYNMGKEIVATAIRKLRHISRQRIVSVNLLVEHRDKQILNAEIIIEDLRDEIKELYKMIPDVSSKQDKLAPHLTSINELGLSSYINNLLTRHGFASVEALLKLNSLDFLVGKLGFGISTRNEVIVSMREKGYSEWADRMDAEWNVDCGLPWNTYKSRMFVKYRNQEKPVMESDNNLLAFKMLI